MNLLSLIIGGVKVVADAYRALPDAEKHQLLDMVHEHLAKHAGLNAAAGLGVQIVKGVRAFIPGV